MHVFLASSLVRTKSKIRKILNRQATATIASPGKKAEEITVDRGAIRTGATDAIRKTTRIAEIPAPITNATASPNRIKSPHLMMDGNATAGRTLVDPATSRATSRVRVTNNRPVNSKPVISTLTAR